MDNSGEFEVKDILDSHFVHCGHYLIEEFFVKWLGCALFKATWELLTNLMNYPDILSSIR